jgi:protein SCO1/2
MIGNEPTGQWMRNSAVDNPRFLATTMINFLGLRKSSAPVHSYADAHLVGNIHQAEYLFHARCTACHTIGGGPGVGPDLAGVTKKRDRAWLARFIIDPDAVFAAGDPIAKEMLAKYHNVRMPVLYVSPQLVPDLLAYIDGQSSVSPGQGKREGTVAAAPAVPAHASMRNPAMPP